MSFAQVIMLIALLILVLKAPKEALFLFATATIVALIIHGYWLIAIVTAFICVMVVTGRNRKKQNDNMNQKRANGGTTL